MFLVGTDELSYVSISPVVASVSDGTMYAFADDTCALYTVPLHAVIQQQIALIIILSL